METKRIKLKDFRKWRNEMKRLDSEIGELKQFIGRYEKDLLIKRRKLVLLVDLDQTLLHTSEADKVTNEGVFYYKLKGDPSQRQFQTRIRPHTDIFLENMSELFEMRICTMGNREYAYKMASFMDKNGHYFADRITCREDIESPDSKTGLLNSLFPIGDHLVVIIDDQEDVWDWAPNLIGVKPYVYFGQAGTNHLNDNDDYLLHLEGILRTIHHNFFQAYDANSESASLLHVKRFFPNILRRRVEKRGNPCQVPSERQTATSVACRHVDFVSVPPKIS